MGCPRKNNPAAVTAILRRKGGETIPEYGVLAAFVK
jgi:hypothetical protein